jgi:hypothetical protein
MECAQKKLSGIDCQNEHKRQSALYADTDTITRWERQTGSERNDCLTEKTAHVTSWAM